MTTRKQRRRKLNKKQPQRILPGILIVLVAFVLLGLVIKVSLSQADRSESNSVQISSNDSDQRWAYIMTDLIGQTRHFKGSPDAPVTILEFSDFQ